MPFPLLAVAAEGAADVAVGGAAVEATTAVVGTETAVGTGEILTAAQRAEMLRKAALAAAAMAAASSRVCASCAKDIPCFTTPKKGDPKEMDKQLKEQQDKINDMSPEDIEKNLDKFEQDGRPNDSSARAQARNTAQEAKQQELSRQYQSDGMSPAAADAQASSNAADFMSGQDATHDLDWVAGGDGSISGTGGSSENRSIGSQWAKKGEGESETRAQNLRDEAKKAKKEGKKKMNVKLRRC